MAAGSVRVVKRHTMLSGDGRDQFRVYCEEKDADQVIISFGHSGEDWVFNRKPDGTWPWELDKLLRGFAKAYEQGDSDARKDIRDTMRGVLGV